MPREKTDTRGKTNARDKPWYKRWPGEYSFKLHMADPHGKQLGMETATNKQVAQVIVKLLTHAAVEAETSQKFLNLCENLNIESTKLIQEKNP